MNEVDKTRISMMIDADIRRMEEMMRKAREEGKPMNIAFAGVRLSASDDLILRVWDAFDHEQTTFLRDFETDGIPFSERSSGDDVGPRVVVLSDGGPWYSFHPGSLISMIVARETRRMLSRESLLRQILPPLPLDIE